VFDFHQQQSKEAGCDDFIPKPFQVKRLFELLQQYLNLTWIYEEETKETDGKTQENLAAAPFIGPPAKQAAMLYEMAMIGDAIGIQNVLAELEKADVKYLPCVTMLRRLADNFDDQKICELVQQYR
jgi:hypothetical protein